MSKTIVIIPARAGSKRLPNKNTLLLQGIPLVAHSILYAKQFSFIDDIFVTTNDSKVKEIALQYNAKVIDRPEELSGDIEPTVSALKHALEFINNVEHVVLLQPTNPLRPSNLLFDAFEIYQKTLLDKQVSKAVVAQIFSQLLNETDLTLYSFETDDKLKYLVDAINYVKSN